MLSEPSAADKCGEYRAVLVRAETTGAAYRKHAERSVAGQAESAVWEGLRGWDARTSGRFTALDHAIRDARSALLRRVGMGN